jgi:hypothetical protein
MIIGAICRLAAGGHLDCRKTTTGELRTILSVLVIVILPLPASAQSQTAGEFWPVINVHLQFPDHWRLLGFAGLKKGEDFAYQQVNAGLGLGYQWKSISKPHPENINPDKEHTFLFGGGYEYLRTTSDKPKYENRFVLEGVLSVSLRDSS